MIPKPAFSVAAPFGSSASRRRERTWHRFTCALKESETENPSRGQVTQSNVSFSNWAKENAVDMPSLQLNSFPQNSAGDKKSVSGRGMMVMKAVKKGQSLISIPQSTALQVTTQGARRSNRPEGISLGTWKTLPWYARLALLIIEAKLDASNKWHAWALLLPESFNTPFHWSSKELKELQNPRIIDAVKEQQKTYRKVFNDINRSTDNPFGRNLDYELFVWGIECVRSRSFSGALEVAPFKERLGVFIFLALNTILWPTLHLLPWQNALNGGLTALFALTSYDIILPQILKVVQGVQLKRYAMTPGIDFLNHSSSVAGTAEVSYEFFSDKFVVRAGEDYETGAQAYISYGAQSNDSFLQFYGFVEPDNPSDTYTFDKSVEDFLGVREGRLIARREGFDGNTMKAVEKRLNNKRESAVTTLKKLCKAELDNFETTIEQDMQLLKAARDVGNARLELAVQYRVEKKKVLQAAFESTK